MRRIRCWLPIAISLLGGVAVIAQEEASTDATFRARVTEVVAPTTILDKSGNYVSGLKPSEFRLFDNDRLQNIRVTETFAPISLVVAIQANANVENILPTIQKMGTMLNSMVAGDGGDVAVLAFDHRLQLLQDFTSDPTKIQEAMQKIRAGSSSSRMIDATIESARLLSKRPKDRRRVLLLVSESRDIASEGKPREALTALEMANVLVYVANISRLRSELTAKAPPPRPDPIPVTARPSIPGVPQTPTAMANVTGMGGNSVQFGPIITEIFRATKAIFVDNPAEIFTKYTGGKERGFMTQRDLEHAMAEIGREIHNQYIITYNPSNKEEGGFHNIRVEIARNDLEVRTRPGYWLAAVVQ
jgi:VWFA-related protein